MVNADSQYIEYNLLDSYILLIGIIWNTHDLATANTDEFGLRDEILKRKKFVN